MSRRSLLLLTGALLGMGGSILVPEAKGGVFEVNEAAIVAAILETESFTSEQLEQLDITNDGQVDARDLACYFGDCSAIPNFVSFTTSTMSVEEGDAPLNVTLGFDRLFQGNLLLEVDTESTAEEASDYQPFTTNISVNGKFADFDLSIIDDALASEQFETILIRIVQSPDYYIGGAGMLTINIRDNDEIWLGSVNSPFGGNEIRLEIVREAGQEAQVVLVSDGTANYPEGRYSATSFFETEAVFELDFDSVPIIADGTTIVPVLSAGKNCGLLSEGEAVLRRGLRLRTDTGLGHDLGDELISGAATELITSECSDYAYLERSIPGFSYLLVRQLAVDVDWVPETCQLGSCSWEEP